MLWTTQIELCLHRFAQTEIIQPGMRQAICRRSNAKSADLLQEYASTLDATVPSSVSLDSSVPTSTQPRFNSEFPTISQPSTTISLEVEGRFAPTLLDPLYTLLNRPMTQVPQLGLLLPPDSFPCSHLLQAGWCVSGRVLKAHKTCLVP